MKSKTLFVLGLLTVAITTLVACLRSASSNGGKIPDEVSYNFHIRPIFSDKCFKCHGPDVSKQEAGLRFDIAESAFAPLKETKGAFAIVPGKPEESEMYKRIISVDSSYQMPTPESHLGLLTEREITLIKKWIEQGAKYEKHWAFQKPKKAPLPKVDTRYIVNNEIDNFIINKLEEIGLEPNPETDKEHLLKRVSFDLTGLPPTETMMDRFMADNTPKAYENMVDALLTSPQYGEKMAVEWLDIGRYSDSYGYQDDNVRTQWPWRNWVISAFNRNLAYNDFLTWQIAGDMLPNATKDQVLATGFFRNHKYTEEGGIIEEEYRIEYTLDKTKTFGKGIIGLTVECAQCHDHKYDPISQRDYYQMFAFFNNTKEKGFEGDVTQSKPAKMPVLTIDPGDLKGILSYINNKDTGNLYVSVMGENDTLRPTYILNRGVYDQHGAVVQPAALKSVMTYDTITQPRNRLSLAKWTVSPNNPLTARVFVNRLWMELFGRGLVKTVGDFGMQGELPSHPELLDWLAVDFMQHNWNIKRLVKQMVLSATYCQSSKISSEGMQRDPDNVYLWRSPRIRVKAEFIRDIVLASSGLLNKTIGGPSVKPYQTKGLWEMATSGRGQLATYKQDHGEDLYRRGMYTFIKLTVPPPSMMLFDASNRDQCEVRRSQTNTPLQALMMMNDPTVLEASRVFAQKLMEEKTAPDDKLKKAFRRILCRQPNTKELGIIKEYYNNQLTEFTAKKLDAAATLKVGEYPANDQHNKNPMAALMKTISMLYNMDEAITKT